MNDHNLFCMDFDLCPSWFSSFFI